MFTLTRFAACLAAAASAAALIPAGLPLHARSSEYLQATAIVTDSTGHSNFQCWKLTTPLSVSTSAGTAGAATLALGPLSNDTFTVIPGHFEGGVHNAPHKQCVYSSQTILAFADQSMSSHFAFGT